MFTRSSPFNAFDDRSKVHVWRHRKQEVQMVFITTGGDSLETDLYGKILNCVPNVCNQALR